MPQMGLKHIFHGKRSRKASKLVKTIYEWGSTIDKNIHEWVITINLENLVQLAWKNKNWCLSWVMANSTPYLGTQKGTKHHHFSLKTAQKNASIMTKVCLLYTSDAADE